MWLTLWNVRLVKAAMGRVKYFAIGLGSQLRDGCFLLVMLTVSTPALVQLKRSDQGLVCSNGFQWWFSSQPAALEVATRAMPRRSRKPQAIAKGGPRDWYLSHRSDTEDGGRGSIYPAGGTFGSCALLSLTATALHSFRLLRRGSAPRSLVIYGLLTNPGDVVRCRSDGRPERTRDMMKL